MATFRIDIFIEGFYDVDAANEEEAKEIAASRSYDDLDVIRTNVVVSVLVA